jgi:hypothetical protein
VKDSVEGLVFFLQICDDLPLQFINTKERIFPKQVAAIIPADNIFAANGRSHRFRSYSRMISSFNFLFQIFSLTPLLKKIIHDPVGKEYTGPITKRKMYQRIVSAIDYSPLGRRYSSNVEVQNAPKTLLTMKVLLSSSP